MKGLWQALSAVGLTLTVIPSFLVFAGAIEWGLHATLMLVGTALYFATAPLWMKETKQ